MIPKRAKDRAMLRTALTLAMAGAVACTGGGSAPRRGGAPGSGEDAIERLVRAAGGDVQVRRSRATGLLAFMAVRTGPGVRVSGGRGAEGKAEAFLAEHGAAFGLGELPELKVVRSSRTVDEVGQEHVRLQQTVRGVPVRGAEWAVHLKGEHVVSSHGKTVRARDLEELDLAPKLGAVEARAIALGVVQDTYHVEGTAEEPRLEILNEGLLDGVEGPSRLAWFVEVKAREVREYVWVDAGSGEVLLHFDQTPRALAREIHDADRVERDVSKAKVVRVEGEGPTGDPDVDRLYDELKTDYDHFLQRFGRDSYDGAGAKLVAAVRYPFTGPNAAWAGSVMWVGEGMPGADDVIGHEYTHAIVRSEYDPLYSRAPGALNEAFADIFGETIDLTDGSADDTAAVRWLHGEGGFQTPIRNMANPAQFDMPSTTSDPFFYCGLDGYGEVHHDSSVMSRAYVLMVDGGDFNGRSVQGIGLDKAERVLYRTITTYMASGSGFEEADDGVRQACQDMVGQHGIGADDCVQVGVALDAVELAKGWPCHPPMVHVWVSGQGSVEVVSSLGKVVCTPLDGDCAVEVRRGSAATLRAQADPGSYFLGWDSDCQGYGDTCELSIGGLDASDLEVSASFEPVGEKTYRLEVTYAVGSPAAPGAGVTSSTGEIDCSPECSAEYPAGTVVMLTARPPAGQIVLGWSDGCSGTRSTCKVLMNHDTYPHVVFGPAPFVAGQVLPSTCEEGGEWGDYDADGDLDLLALCSSRPALFRNDGGSLVDSGMTFTGLGTPRSAAWGDHDGDGDLDLVIVAQPEGQGPSDARGYLLRNDSGVLQRSGQELGMAGGPASWGDADGDGDLDLAMPGGEVVRYNDGGFLTAIQGPPWGMLLDLEWGDWDRDGDQDLLASDGVGAAILANTGALLGEWYSPVTRMETRRIAAADYDGDGLLDMAAAPIESEGDRWTALFGQTTGFATAALRVSRGWDLAWGDANADGSPDLLVTGTHEPSTNAELSTLYVNRVRTGGGFEETATGLPELAWSGAPSRPAWADVDGDGRLDVFLGDTLYRNTTTRRNTSPQPPASVSAEVVGDEVRLTWTAGSDAETPAAGLTYNVRVTTPSGREVVPGMADPATGFRRVVGLGNAAGSRMLTLRGLPPGWYYWEVQSIDASFAGSPFTATAVFEIGQNVRLGEEFSVGGMGTEVYTEPTSAGSSYRITVSGMYAVGIERWADAYWESDWAWNQVSPDHTIPGIDCPIGLYVDGRLPDWGPFDPANLRHEYSTVIRGTGQPLELQAKDCLYGRGDNFGALKVKVMPEP